MFPVSITLKAVLKQLYCICAACEHLSTVFSLLFLILSYVLKGELYVLWYAAGVVVATLMAAVVLAINDLFFIKSRPSPLKALGTTDLQTTTGGDFYKQMELKLLFF